MHVKAKFQMTPLLQPKLFELCGEEPAASRPRCLGESPGQERIQQHTVDSSTTSLPGCRSLDALVPQSVDLLLDVFKHIDIPVPEHVIEVPKILCRARPSRAVLMERR